MPYGPDCRQRRTRSPALLICLAVVGTVLQSWMGTAAAKPPPDPALTAELITLLGHRDFATRQAAADYLAAVGTPALAPLRAMAQNPRADCESALRAAHVVEVIVWADVVARWRNLAAKPSATITPAEFETAVFDVARLGQLELDLAPPTRLLDDWASQVRDRLAASSPRQAMPPTARQAAAVLMDVLYRDADLKGAGQDPAAPKDFYLPQNSFLDAVLKRRRGLPILLCVVYQAVGRRAGLSVVGIGAPGRFLCRCDDPLKRPDQHVYVDPYDGKCFTASEFAAAGGDLADLAEAGPLTTLARILNNLRVAYQGVPDTTAQARLQDLDRALLAGPPLPR